MSLQSIEYVSKYPKYTSLTYDDMPVTEITPYNTYNTVLSGIQPNKVLQILSEYPDNFSIDAIWGIILEKYGKPIFITQNTNRTSDRVLVIDLDKLSDVYDIYTKNKILNNTMNNNTMNNNTMNNNIINNRNLVIICLIMFCGIAYYNR